MKWLRYWIVSLFVLCCSPLALASADPVGWSVSGSPIPANTVVNLLYGPLTYTFTNNLPYKLTCPLTVVANINGQFNIISNTCQNVALDPGASCTVVFNFQPTTPGVQSIQLIEHYGKDIVPLPPVTTTVGGGPVPLVTGTLTPGFPANVGAGEQRPFGFTYTNTNNGTVTGVTCPPVVVDQNQTNGGIIGVPVCTCGPVLLPGASCGISGTFQFGVAGPYAIHHTLSYTGGSTTLSTSTTATMNITGQIITNFPVYTPPGGVTGAGEINTLVFRFTNSGSSTVFGVTTATLSAVVAGTGGNAVLGGGPNCNVGTLASGASCDVNVTFSSGLASAPPLNPPYQATVGFNYLGGTNQVPQTAGPIPGEIKVTNTFASPSDDLPANIGTGEDHNVKFTFTNTGAGTAWNITDPSATFSTMGGTCIPAGTSTTCGTTLLPSATCTATCQFRATTTGSGASVTENFTYAGGEVPLMSTTATVTNNVTGAVTSPAPFPSEIGVNVAQPITFTFTNNGTTAVQGPITIDPPGDPNSWTGPITNLCTGASLAASTSCTYSGTFTGRLTGDVTISATFNYSGPPVPASATTNIGRVFTIVNRCNQNVWYSFNGSLTQFTCATNADCPSGSVCNPAANGGSGACYWQDPEPLTGGLLLPPMIGTTPSTSTVIVPDHGTTLGAIWQGQIAGRTNCTGVAPSFACETAACASNDPSSPKGSCKGGEVFGAPAQTVDGVIQPTTPATKAQLQLIKTAVDQYNVQASNGLNLSMAMGPTTSPWGGMLAPYTCARPGYAGIPNPGEAAVAKSFAPCTWTPVLPPSTPQPADIAGRNYAWVRAGSTPASETACVTSSPTCALPGQVCGLRYNASATPTFARVCGVQLGYWTAEQACLANPTDANTFFNCLNVNPNPAGTFLRNLYACAPVVGTNLNNCYFAGSTTSCCGCVDWDTVGAGVPAPPVTQTCGASINTSWTGTVQNTVNWIKQMCPQLRAYPDDTASSQFTCKTDDTATSGPVGATNTTGYSVTFCPEVAVAPFAKKKVIHKSHH